MKKVTAILLEPSDFTKDNNLKRNAFDAVCAHEVVLFGDQVVKNRYGEITKLLTEMRSDPDDQILFAESPELPFPPASSNPEPTDNDPVMEPTDPS